MVIPPTNKACYQSQYPIRTEQKGIPVPEKFYNTGMLYAILTNPDIEDPNWCEVYVYLCEHVRQSKENPEICELELGSSNPVLQVKRHLDKNNKTDVITLSLGNAGCEKDITPTSNSGREDAFIKLLRVFGIAEEWRKIEDSALQGMNRHG